MRVLVVCHGNICRSPVAGVLLASLRPDWVVTSAGMGVKHEGRGASKKARDAAERLGLSLSTHKTRRVTDEMLLKSDRVLYMDNGNLQRLMAHRVTTGLVSLASVIGEKRVPDMNYMSGDDVAQAYAMLERAVRKLAEEGL
jgi:protein-tyrosine phosphatase